MLMSSAAASLGLANHEAIAAAKAGVEGLVRSAAATYASWNVRINAVAPGLVDTPLATSITRPRGGQQVAPAGTSRECVGGGQGCGLSARAELAYRPGAGRRRGLARVRSR